MAVYKVLVNSMEAAANGTVNADAFVMVRVSANPEVWADALNGHRTIVLAATEVLPITGHATMTNAQKRQALKDLVKAKVLAMGIDVADQAYTEFVALIAPPFDVTVRE